MSLSPSQVETWVDMSDSSPKVISKTSTAPVTIGQILQQAKSARSSGRQSPPPHHGNPNQLSPDPSKGLTDLKLKKDYKAYLVTRLLESQTQLTKEQKSIAEFENQEQQFAANPTEISAQMFSDLISSGTHAVRNNVVANLRAKVATLHDRIYQLAKCPRNHVPTRSITPTGHNAHKVQQSSCPSCHMVVTYVVGGPAHVTNEIE